MSAARDSLARWRDAEQGATKGPWRTRDDLHSRLYVMGPLHSVADCGFLDDVVNPGTVGGLVDDIRADGEFIAASRTAMPALLGFAEAVLALHVPVDMLHEPTGHVVTVCTACGTEAGERVYPCLTLRLAEQCLGGGS